MHLADAVCMVFSNLKALPRTYDQYQAWQNALAQVLAAVEAGDLFSDTLGLLHFETRGFVCWAFGQVQTAMAQRARWSLLRAAWTGTVAGAGA
jgi:hypothetical protein